MKKATKFLSLVMASAMILSATACGTGSGSAKAKYNVGICQLVEHPALDAATQGFQDALKEKLGDDVAFDVKNAQNDSPTCSTITNTFVSNGYDLILANATPSLQAASASTAEIPILGTSITDYATALGISDWTGVTGKNISGTSDLAPLDKQAECIKELFPDATLEQNEELDKNYHCDIKLNLNNNEYYVWSFVSSTRSIVNFAQKFNIICEERYQHFSLYV